jgi:hypothetical protein
MTVNRTVPRLTLTAKQPPMTIVAVLSAMAKAAGAGVAAAAAGVNAATIRSQALLPVINPMSRRMLG